MKKSALLWASFLPSFVITGAMVQLGPRGFAASFAEPHGQQSSTSNPTARPVGVIKVINGNVITLTPDSGAEVNITVQDTTRIMRIAPGETTLKNATPVKLEELQVGDRILTGGKASDDGKSFAASTIVVMKHSDVEANHEQQRQDWQKRGLGGLVSAVDANAGTVTISVTGLGGAKTNVTVHTSKDTVIRRYAPDSVKFDDAKPSTLQQIQAGDQLRARGERNADRTEIKAEEIVTGSFRNIAGTVISADASSGTLNVQDLLSKKAVQLKITADSQLHKLPAEMAQRIATRLKGGAVAGIAGVPGAAAGSTASPAAGATENGTSGGPPAGGYGGARAGGGISGAMRSGGAPDLQQMLSRTPVVALADLHKGDAVIVVATQGTTSSAPTAITLVSGVEPILQAAPNGSQAMMLTPWSLSGPSGDTGSQ